MQRETKVTPNTCFVPWKITSVCYKHPLEASVRSVGIEKQSLDKNGGYNVYRKLELLASVEDIAFVGIIVVNALRLKGLTQIARVEISHKTRKQES